MARVVTYLLPVNGRNWKGSGGHDKEYGLARTAFTYALVYGSRVKTILVIFVVGL